MPFSLQLPCLPKTHMDAWGAHSLVGEVSQRKPGTVNTNCAGGVAWHTEDGTVTYKLIWQNSDFLRGFFPTGRVCYMHAETTWIHVAPFGWDFNILILQYFKSILCVWEFCLHVCLHTKRACWIPRNWSYRLLWTAIQLLRLKPGFSAEAAIVFHLWAIDPVLRWVI